MLITIVVSGLRTSCGSFPDYYCSSSSMAAISGSRARFVNLFGNVKGAVIGMVHVQALPGTPCHELSMDEIVGRACSEAEIYRECGLDGIVVENMHDIPYLRGGVGPEITAAMTRVCAEVRKMVPGMPLGVQVLAGANKEGLAVAKAAGGNFIRAEGFVFSHVADEGWMDACAGDLLRYRKTIGAEDVLIFTDIKKKHSSHAVTSDLDAVDMAQAAKFFLSDGLILTGQATGLPTNTDEIQRVRHSVDLPVLVGSGVTADNLGEYMNADALIVGSDFKVDGKWYNPVDKERVVRFMDRFTGLRKKE